MAPSWFCEFYWIIETEGATETLEFVASWSEVWMTLGLPNI